MTFNNLDKISAYNDFMKYYNESVQILIKENMITPDLTITNEGIRQINMINNTDHELSNQDRFILNTLMDVFDKNMNDILANATVIYLGDDFN